MHLKDRRPSDKLVLVAILLMSFVRDKMQKGKRKSTEFFTNNLLPIIFQLSLQYLSFAIRNICIFNQQ